MDSLADKLLESVKDSRLADLKAERLRYHYRNGSLDQLLSIEMEENQSAINELARQINEQLDENEVSS